MADVPLRLIGDLMCVGLCVVATVFDLRTRRIPNVLTIPAGLVGLGFAVLEGGSVSLVGAALGVALLGGIFAMVASVGGMGWGDVKLMAAVGALLGWPVGSWAIVLYALLYTALVGGVLAIVMAAMQQRLGAALKATVALPRRREKRPTSGVTIPYGAAICLGTLWAVAGRWMPALLIG